MKLFDSEWKVMEVLWQKNDRTAKEISVSGGFYRLEQEHDVHSDKKMYRQGRD